jgi:hypothetical protein
MLLIDLGWFCHWCCLCAHLAGVEKAFALDEGSWDWVVNLAAETKYGQTEEVYKEKVLDLSVKVATKAAELHVPKFIELSHAQVYAHGKVSWYTTHARTHAYVETA